MGCSSCSSGSCGTPNGCGNNGHCASGGCNKLNTFDWLSDLETPTATTLDIIEVSFKNGVRKDFYRLPSYVHVVTGDMVAVDASSGGYDIGRVSLQGELVRLQMKKRKLKKKNVFPNVLREANTRDLERLQEARDKERDTMIRARAIAGSLGLEMKIGEVEFQGDNRKATFYYTADGRVDFRELIRVFAREFKVKIEMRQIGARQESALIGGLGPCGRELCCSTWLTDFKSVSTVAARYQNLAINQAKLSGQCGRLKCCLNFELNTYLDALKDFPRNVDKLDTKKGEAFLLKTDIFKRIMHFAYHKEFGGLEVFPLSVERVKEIAAMNRKGKKPGQLVSDIIVNTPDSTESSGADEFVDGSGSLELKELETKKRGKGRKRRNNRKRNRKGGNKNSKGNSSNNNKGKSENQNSSQKEKKEDNKGGNNQNRKHRNNKKRRNKRRNNKRGPKSNNNNNDKK